MHELGRGILLPDRLIDMKRLEVPLASLDINWLPGTFRDFLINTRIFFLRQDINKARENIKEGSQPPN